MKILKKGILAAVMAGSMILSACGSKGPDGVVAKVNDVEIPEQDFIVEYAATRNNVILRSQAEGSTGEEFLQEKAAGSDLTIDQSIREMALRNVIDMEILRQYAEKNNITYDIEDYNKQMESLLGQYGGQEGYEAALKEVGLSPEYYENMLKNMHMQTAIYDALSEQLAPSDEEIKKHYDDNKDDYVTFNADHILVADKDEAIKIKKEIEGGKDFAEAAKEYSTDPGSKENGGALGDFSPGTMVPEFENAVKLLKEGEISDPVESQFGYHLIRLNSKKTKEFEEVKDSIKDLLVQDKFKEEIAKIEKEAKVEKYLDPKKDFELPAEFKINTGTETPSTDSPAENAANAPAENNAEANAEANTNKK